MELVQYLPKEKSIRTHATDIEHNSFGIMEIYSKARTIFTPNAPINDHSLLAGRDDELAELDDLYNQPGSQIIIVGDRGVGKTSLVHNSCLNIYSVRVNCSRNLTFDGLARHILRELKIDPFTTSTTKETSKKLKGGFKLGASIGAEEIEKVSETLSGYGTIELTSLHLFDVIKELGKKVIIVIDQFESLPKTKGSTLVEIADFMKCLSDQSHKHNCTLVVVGVGKTAEDLLGKRETIHRCVTEIKIKPLTEKQILKFLNTAEERTGSEIQHNVKTALAKDSLGYPYFAHLVGLCTYQARKRRIESEAKNKKISNLIRPDDYEEGKSIASGKVYKTNLKKYKDSIDRLETIEREVLRHINGLKRKTLIINDLWTSFENVMTFSTEELRGGFRSIVEKEIITIDNYTLSFSDPLLRPFLRIQFGLPRKDNESTQLQLFKNSEIKKRR